MKKFMVIAGVIIVTVAGVLLVNTFLFPSMQITVEPAEENPVYRKRAIDKLSAAVRIPTVSFQDSSRMDYGRFEEFIGHLYEQFPLLHEELLLERISDYSLLYRWEGRDTTLSPLLLTAHYDVVPADESEGWVHPPFSGEVVDGYIWGRGTLDDKVGVIGIMEAVETLLEEGFRPQRPIYLGFGHDEEVGGYRGAAVIADTLGARGVQPVFVVDEGMMIVDGLLPGLDRPVALIGIGEKGFISVQLTARAEGGHSSTPPRQTAVGRVSRAVAALEEQQMPVRLVPAVEAMFDYLGSEMSFAPRMIMANRWLFSPLLKSRLAASRETNALVRTTTAPTIFRAGEKDNVLPVKAEAVVNFRMLPGDSVESVLGHVRKVVQDTLIEVSTLNFAANPRPQAGINTSAFEQLHRTVKEVYPEVLVAPSLLVGTSDARHYTRLTRHVYSFNPYMLTSEDISRFHGLNERIDVDDFRQFIFYYYRLLKNVTESP